MATPTKSDLDYLEHVLGDHLNEVEGFLAEEDDPKERPPLIEQRLTIERLIVWVESLNPDSGITTEPRILKE